MSMLLRFAIDCSVDDINPSRVRVSSYEVTLVVMV